MPNTELTVLFSSVALHTRQPEACSVGQMIILCNRSHVIPSQSPGAEAAMWHLPALLLTFCSGRNRNSEEWTLTWAPPPSHHLPPNCPISPAKKIATAKPYPQWNDIETTCSVVLLYSEWLAVATVLTLLLRIHNPRTFGKSVTGQWSPILGQGRSSVGAQAREVFPPL